jgi:hypothetical protein
VTVTNSKNPRSDKKFDQAREEASSSEGAPPPTQNGAVPANTGGRKRLKTRAPTVEWPDCRAQCASSRLSTMPMLRTFCRFWQ